MATRRRPGSLWRAGPNGETATVDIPVDDVNTDLRSAPQAGGREVLRVEVAAPSPLLQGGLALSIPLAWVATGSRTFPRRWGCCPTPTPC